MSRTPRSENRLSKAVLVATLAAAVLIQPVTASAVSRDEVLARASSWTKEKVPYSQRRSYEGYRTDCSGFVSMAWGLDKSLTTWTLPEVAEPIKKSELRPGDILLHRTPGAARHVVLFGGWANRSHTKYIGYEHNGPVGYAVRRIIPYPFFFDKGKYKPYRYKDITDGPTVRTDGYVDTIGGSDRYVTAVEASRKAFSEGAETVVVTSGSSPYDALGAASLAGAVDGPMLLVRQDRLHGQVRSEVDRLGAKEVLIVGDGDAVSSAVARALAATGAEVSRIHGYDRYSTSERVAAETVRRLKRRGDASFDGTVMLASAVNPVDAIAAAPLAAKKGWPVLLTHPGDLSKQAARAMESIGAKKAYVLGSGDVIGSKTARKANEIAEEVERVGGYDRYDTSVKIAALARRNGMTIENAALVSSARSNDAIAAGVAQSRSDSLVLLTRKSRLPRPVERVIETNRTAIGEVRLIGKNAVTNGVEQEVAKRMGAPLEDQ